MNFNEYQIKAKSTDIYPADRALNSEFSSDTRRQIALELGDVLWYLANIATDIGYELEYLATMNIQKLADRKERNKIGGSGDHR